MTRSDHRNCLRHVVQFTRIVHPFGHSEAQLLNAQLVITQNKQTSKNALSHRRHHQDHDRMHACTQARALIVQHSNYVCVIIHNTHDIHCFMIRVQQQEKERGPRDARVTSDNDTLSTVFIAFLSSGLYGLISISCCNTYDQGNKNPCNLD